MLSAKILFEYCNLNCKFNSLTIDLLPKVHRRRDTHSFLIFKQSYIMAEHLYAAINAMSIEDDEPINLPDSPRFKVFDENSVSLLGRLLNPDCQSMSRMIEDMPRVWRVYDRVRGIALSRDRFQFIFQREEDLLTVLKDRPWSYNHWTMLLERWTEAPPTNFLSSLKVWVRMRNIPVNHFTIETMERLGAAIGEVDEIAYDAKLSQTKDFIRARIILDIANPARESKVLNLPSGTSVIITYEYKKIRKRCFHCLRLTHEKAQCPLLKMNSSVSRFLRPKPVENKVSAFVPLVSTLDPTSKALEVPPGFPPMFPELSKQD